MHHQHSWCIMQRNKLSKLFHPNTIKRASVNFIRISIKWGDSSNHVILSSSSGTHLYMGLNWRNQLTEGKARQESTHVPQLKKIAIFSTHNLFLFIVQIVGCHPCKYKFLCHLLPKDNQKKSKIKQKKLWLQGHIKFCLALKLPQLNRRESGTIYNYTPHNFFKKEKNTFCLAKFCRFSHRYDVFGASIIAFFLKKVKNDFFFF